MCCTSSASLDFRSQRFFFPSLLLLRRFFLRFLCFRFTAVSFDAGDDDDDDDDDEVEEEDDEEDDADAAPAPAAPAPPDFPPSTSSSFSFSFSSFFIFFFCRIRLCVFLINSSRFLFFFVLGL
jgi:hypothetical protein